ncbi:ABC transporter permease subunit [uncultured Pseudokineococcus sp.]|uniref:ABC transporter permease subunit n=1 Tax=uncultured Pseudokineococcus sp. TaxID=1642928 RepID=UPI002613274F|nr:ABC transporter permease subunit [uncultured Pseudokineococcus sp.]
MVQQQLSTAPQESPAAHPPPVGSRSVPVLLLKVAVLAVLLSTVVSLTPALVAAERWGFLVFFWVLVVLVVAVYATRRAIPLKYLLPGAVLLLSFVVYPVISTFQVSLTNLGDGTRATREEATAQIIGSSVVQTPDAPRYNLTVGTAGSPTAGPFAFLLVDPASGEASVGTEDGLEPLPGATVTDGFVTAADGYELLTPVEVNDASAALAELTVPTEGGAIRQLGIRQAFEGSTPLVYDEDAETITNTQTGVTYAPELQGDREFYVDPDGQRLSDQSWAADVGFDNYVRAFTDARILSDFVGIFGWTLVFATLSVASTFALGTVLAVVLNDRRVRGQKVYRSVLLLPYAIPSFISLLLWSGFWNTDFGLVNDLTGLGVNWFGGETTAKAAVLITNLWLGFPYMFLVVTGALQAIPEDLKEAAGIDGASGFTGFRTIIFPLLLIPTAPLLVASFAFNFNNFNTIFLLTGGGPFTPDNPTAGGTDLLISYTIRLAFGASGAQFGFASAIAVLLFVITGVVAALQFRLTRRLEDVI